MCSSDLFAEGLEAFRLLQSVGVDPSGELLAPLRSFGDFPKQPEWYSAARGEALGSVESLETKRPDV